ncbi:hypothetical protein AGMMS49940_17030 [Spirochaetia bacterium]|nr:hypothetical protein AGMMS49940_17030 [Spirochaetia bacterium]
MIYALDTNIVSYYMADDKKIWDKIRSFSREGNQFIIPLIVYYEIRRGLLSVSAPVKSRFFNDLCKEYDLGVMNKKTGEIAAAIYAGLRKKGALLEDADILIAASCIQHGYPLVTNNTDHFKNIDGLRLTNWAA